MQPGKYTPLFSARTALDFDSLSMVIDRQMNMDSHGEKWSLISQDSEGREAELLYRLDAGKRPGLELLFLLSSEPNGTRMQSGYGGETKGFNKAWTIVRRRSDAIELDIIAADGDATIGHFGT